MKLFLSGLILFLGINFKVLADDLDNGIRFLERRQKKIQKNLGIMHELMLKEVQKRQAQPADQPPSTGKPDLDISDILRKKMRGQKLSTADQEKLNKQLEIESNRNEQARKSVVMQLKDKKSRDHFFKENPGKKWVVLDINALVKEFNLPQSSKQNIFDLAADVFNEIYLQSEGDSKKMQQIIEKAKKDPGAFAESWSPGLQQKLRSISTSGSQVKPKDRLKKP